MSTSAQPETTGPSKILVTSALPYANNNIHLGHLFEAVQTDIYVRYHRLRGATVRYVCADDTHGTPIELAALRQKIAPELLVEQTRKDHMRDYAGFNISFDIFYTTNSDENRKYAEFIYKKLRDNDLIVEKEISQYYCEHDKRFLPDRFIVGGCPRCKAEKQYGDVCEVCGATYDPTELSEPKCIICNNPPVLRQSRHFYVQLKKCEGFLREYIGSSGALQGDIRNFVTSWIDDGLKEWCISRDGPYFGFKIPDTENKFFYVWLDAPIGYISSTDRYCKDHGERVEDYWGCDADTKVVHFIGKDIVYFHALFWPVMLKNAGFKLPSRIFVHGFLNIEGEKMSKSRGTFILAKDYLEKVKHPQAPEFLRFYFASKQMPNTGDVDLNKSELLTKTATTLANNIGNLHHRTLVFCDRYFQKSIPDAPWDESIATIVEEAGREISRYYESGEFKSVVEKIHALGSLGNKYYQDAAPWEQMKTDPSKAASVMVTCVNLIKALAVFLKPITPEITGSIERQIGTILKWEDYVFSLRNKPLGVTDKIVKPFEESDLDAVFAAASQNKAQQVSAATPGLIDINHFKAVDLKIAVIKSAERVEKSSKLLKLQVEIGKETRQIVAGIAAHYKPEDLPGRQVVVVANLKPATLFGLTSEGMLLCAQNSGGELVLIHPEKPVNSGVKVG
jgi:methionyl-tRNA synthetase